MAATVTHPPPLWKRARSAPSEHKPQAELQQALRALEPVLAAGPGDPPCGRRSDVGSRVVELRRVRHVEEFRVLLKRFDFGEHHHALALMLAFVLNAVHHEVVVRSAAAVQRRRRAAANLRQRQAGVIRLDQDDSRAVAHQVHEVSGDVRAFLDLLLGAQRAQCGGLGLQDRPDGFRADRFGYRTGLEFEVDRDSRGQVQRDFFGCRPRALAGNRDAIGSRRQGRGNVPSGRVRLPSQGVVGGGVEDLHACSRNDRSRAVGNSAAEQPRVDLCPQRCAASNAASSTLDPTGLLVNAIFAMPTIRSPRSPRKVSRPETWRVALR